MKTTSQTSAPAIMRGPPNRNSAARISSRQGTYASSAMSGAYGQPAGQAAQTASTPAPPKTTPRNALRPWSSTQE